MIPPAMKDSGDKYDFPMWLYTKFSVLLKRICVFFRLCKGVDGVYNFKFIYRHSTMEDIYESSLDF